MSEKNYPVSIDEAALKAKLDPLSYEVLRNAATERPFTGEYTDTDKVGVYKCKACSAELSAVKLSFTLVAAGHLSMLQLQMMLLSSLKIVHYFHVLELKCDVLHAVHT